MSVFRALVLLVAFAGSAFIGQAQAQPDPPRDFSATAQGVLVAPSWVQNNDFRRTYVVEAGTGPGRTDIGSFPLPWPGVNWYGFSNVPNGTYHLRLRAVVSSQMSAPSNEVVVTVTGCAEPPAAA